MAVANVVQQRAPVDGRDRRRHQQADREASQPEHAAGAAAARLEPRRGRNGEQQQHRRQEPGRRARAGPPHLKRADRQRVGHDHRQQLDREPRVTAEKRDESERGTQVHRRVRQNAELLIKREAYQTARQIRKAALTGPAVGRARIGYPVDRVEEPEPTHGAAHGDGKQRDRAPWPHWRAQLPEQDQRAKDARGDGEPRVQPGQDGQRQSRRCKAAQAGGALVGLDERQHAQHHDRRARRVRIHHERLKEERQRQRDGRPAKPGGGDVTSDAPRRDPGERGRPAGNEREEQQDAAVPEDCEHRRDKNRKAGRMDRVDLADGAAAQEIRAQVRCEVRVIIAPAVVVLDP